MGSFGAEKETNQEIITLGDLPMANEANQLHDLYDLSHPFRVTQCDAFVSHSWHEQGHRNWFLSDEFQLGLSLDTSLRPHRTDLILSLYF